MFDLTQYESQSHWKSRKIIKDMKFEEEEEEDDDDQETTKK